MKTLLTRLLLLCSVIFLFINVGKAQTKLQGTLQDSSAYTPLAYANVALLNQGDSSFVTGTTTDDKGVFELMAPDSGNYFLRISYLGYGTQLKPVWIETAKKEMNMGILAIPKASQDLGEVTIVGQKPMYSYDGEKKVYNVSEDPSVQGGVANDALQNAPGVYVDMEGNITLRGVSGVEIWLNDKPSRIKAEGLKSFLQQLPANAIERIEVITNPSARYGAEGTAGIINIITREKIKRNLLFSFGFNGSTQVTYSPWASFVVGNDKISFNTYISKSSFENTYSSNSSGVVLNNGDTVYSFTGSNAGGYGYGWTYGHVSLTWEINKNNTFDLWGGGSFSNNNSHNSGFSTRTMADGELFAFSDSASSDGDGSNLYGGLSLEHRFKKEGHKFTLDCYAGNYQQKSLRTTEKLFSVQTEENLRYRDVSNNDGTWLSGELNYENPLGKNRFLEVGGELEYSSSIEDSPIDTFNFSSEQYLYVDLFSNHLDQTTVSGALYTTYSDTLGFLSYKAGLRYEFASLDMISVALPDKLHRTYGTLFPTLHLSTKTKNNDNYSLSYSRRVQYPQWGLDPFINRVDGESIYGGNPWLDPAFTDAFEAGYAHFFKSGSSISATLYHRRTNLDITQKSEGVFDTLLNRYTIYTTFINAGKKIFTGADLTFTWRPKPAYRIMFNANLYNQDFFADLGSYTVDKHDLTYDGKLIFMWNYKILRLNVMGIYRAAAASLQGNNDPNYWINVTANADLFKKTVSLRLGMNDIFNWMERSSETNTPTYISTNSSKMKTQFLTFGITVRLGKVELEQQQMPPQNGAPQ